jgi:hypothetical protein
LNHDNLHTVINGFIVSVCEICKEDILQIYKNVQICIEAFREVTTQQHGEELFEVPHLAFLMVQMRLEIQFLQLPSSKRRKII